ncbi:MAG TPA: nucleotidyltransferase domain-containing protein [Candidatus Gracilibacteria bacterium]
MEEVYKQKAQKWARVLGFIPTLEAVFLSGSLATGKATKDSDIDFFILTRPGTIWFTRFWVFFILKICGQLAKPHHHAGRICPNHFITTDHLRLREQNAYSAEMFSQNLPLYDPQSLFVKFAEANKWVEKFGHHFPITNNKKQSTKTRRFIFEIGSLLLISLEPFFAYPQKWWIQHSKIYQKGGHGMVLEKYELRFHPVLKSRVPRD